MTTSKRLNILTESLSKKEKELDEKIAEHFRTVKQANGQPLNDKRNGQATLNKWEKQSDAIRKTQEGVEKTKRAIEVEQAKIEAVENAQSVTPAAILDLVASGVLTQWRKHPNTFFVVGVDRARIVWDNQKKVLAHKYISTVTDKDQRSNFAKVYNCLKSVLDAWKSPAEAARVALDEVKLCQPT